MFTLANRSFNGCYKIVNRNLEWSIAGLHCRSLHKDAHLLVINDGVEQWEVSTMLQKTNSQFIAHVLLYFLNVES